MTKLTMSKLRKQQAAAHAARVERKALTTAVMTNPATTPVAAAMRAAVKRHA